MSLVNIPWADAVPVKAIGETLSVNKVVSPRRLFLNIVWIRPVCGGGLTWSTRSSRPTRTPALGSTAWPASAGPRFSWPRPSSSSGWSTRMPWRWFEGSAGAPSILNNWSFCQSTRDASISSRGGTNAGFSKMLCDAVYWPTSKKEPAGYILYLCIKLRLEDLGHCFCNSPPATCITWINDWTCNYISGLYFSIMSKVTNNWIFAYFVFVIFHNNLLV